MHRLARYDVPARFSRPRTLRRLAIEVAFGSACALLMIGTRTVVDIWLPGSGPFAAVYPAVMLSALYGRWQSGIVTFLLAFTWAWWWILPFSRSFALANDDDLARIAVNAVCVAIIILFAEVFRRAVEQTTAERDLEIERRENLHLELAHRTKNNFALVASLLHTQRRQEADPALHLALDKAIGRVQSFAEAYSLVSEGSDGRELVEMDRYLRRLAESLSPAMFANDVDVVIAVDRAQFPREKAVALGLACNEAMTNAAKYAFQGRQGGKVEIRLSGDAENWTFEVSDDGIGMAEPESSGIGSRLLDAFASQADAVLEISTSGDGTTLRLRSR